MPGDNIIRVEVATTLFNGVKARINELESVYFGPMIAEVYELSPWQDYGLVGPVEVKVLGKVAVS